MTMTLKKIVKGVLYLMGALLIVLLLATFILWIKSPGKPQPITDSYGVTIPQSISSIEKIILGGVAHSPIVEEAEKFNSIVLDITKKF